MQIVQKYGVICQKRLKRLPAETALMAPLGTTARRHGGREAKRV